MSVFDGSLVGLGAIVPSAPGGSIFSAPTTSSPIGPHVIRQTSGDPNYYPTKPAFDARGFWHSAGTFAPKSAPAPGGSWVQQGTVERNGRSTPLWIWYPAKGHIVTFRNASHEYRVSRSSLRGSKKVLPSYWVYVSVVPKSKYGAQTLEYRTVDNIVPVVGSFECKRWFLVATFGLAGYHADIVGSMFNPDDVFKYYLSYVGVSPYFTYRGYLFHFGRDSRGRNTISICIDGLNVQKNPRGQRAEYTVYPSGGGSGGVLRARV